MSYVVVHQLTKQLANTNVLQDVNLTAEKNQVVGLVGENGSGKTMLLRAIAGLILPSSGYVLVDGKKIGKDIEFPLDMGILIEEPALLKSYSAYDNLAMLQSITKKVDPAEIARQLDRVGLSDAQTKKVRAFSLGMKQRLGIAEALLDSPKLILLDEPTNALDEEGTSTLANLIKQEKESGSCIIIASHDREFMQEVCDVSYNMRAGKLLKTC